MADEAGSFQFMMTYVFAPLISVGVVGLAGILKNTVGKTKDNENDIKALNKTITEWKPKVDGYDALNAVVEQQKITLKETKEKVDKALHEVNNLRQMRVSDDEKIRKIDDILTRITKLEASDGTQAEAIRGLQDNVSRLEGSVLSMDKDVSSSPRIASA